MKFRNCTNFIVSRNSIVSVAGKRTFFGKCLFPLIAIIVVVLQIAILAALAVIDIVEWVDDSQTKVTK